MQLSLDQLVNKGLQLLDDSGDPSAAHRAHERWVRDVNEWLSAAAPNSGVTAEWAAFGSSPFVYGGAYYDEPGAWVSHMVLIRRRLKWMAEHGAIGISARRNQLARRR